MKKSLVFALGLAFSVAVMAQDSGTPAKKPVPPPKPAVSNPKPPVKKAAQVPGHVSSGSSANSPAAEAQKKEARTVEAPASTAGTVESMTKKPTKKTVKKTPETQPEEKPNP